MVGILVLGTVATIFVAQAPVAVAPTTQPPTSTPISQGPLDELVAQGDQAAARGEWAGAISLYSAYLQQNPGSPDVNFKLGKAYASSTPPDYAKASQYLQESVRLNSDGTFAQEARTLLAEVSTKITPGATTSVPITGTTTLTGTAIAPAVTVTSTTGITATQTTTGTVTTP